MVKVLSSQEIKLNLNYKKILHMLKNLLHKMFFGGGGLTKISDDFQTCSK